MGLDARPILVLILGEVLFIGALFLDRWADRARFEPELPPEFHRQNPVPEGPDVLLRGQAVFKRNCLPCHGPEGRGDGPASSGLKPRPRNLHDPEVRKLTDAYLFWRMSQGKPHTAMPGFDTSLSEEDRWTVVRWIRSLKE